MDAHQDTDRAARRRKFRHTRELIRIALHDGMTQRQIAAVCRTQQSQVSDWATGKRKARVDQLTALIKKYGHRLNRTSSRIYNVRCEPAVPWEETEQGRVVTAAMAEYETVPEEPAESKEVAREALQRALSEVGSGLAGGTSSVWEMKALYEMGAAGQKVVRVEGPVVFQHSFESPAKLRMRRLDGPSIEWRPVRRWAVHALGGDRLRLVRSELLVLPKALLPRWEREIFHGVKGGTGRHNLAHDHPEVHSRDPAGRWISQIEDPCTVAALIARADELLRHEGVHDQMTVPFLFRKALVVAGHDVPGVETLTATPS